MEIKSDIAVFGIKIVGVIIGTVGVLFGLIELFFNVWFGIIIIIISIFIGKFLVFKSDRRRGHILYDGGAI